MRRTATGGYFASRCKAHPCAAENSCRVALRPRAARAKPDRCQPSHERGRVWRGIGRSSLGSLAPIEISPRRAVAWQALMSGDDVPLTVRIAPETDAARYRSPLRRSGCRKDRTGGADRRRWQSCVVVALAGRSIGVTHADQFGDWAGHSGHLDAAVWSITATEPPASPVRNCRVGLTA
jgi:hypothetical protein